MRKLSVKDLIDFRRKSDRGKKTFVNNMKSPRIEVPAEGGGDYWISSLSAICNAYRDDDLDLIEAKMQNLQEKISSTKHGITRNMYQKNIATLQKYVELDRGKLRPSEKLSFLKKSTGNPLLNIKGIQVEAKPSHIFTFKKVDKENIGAIWFTAKVDGYRIEEVSMFCEMLYAFLDYNYSQQYQLSLDYCMAVDVFSGISVAYSEIENGHLSEILAPTLDEINKFM